MSANAVSDAAKNAYRNFFGEEITVNSNEATCTVVDGTVQTNPEQFQGGDLLNYDAKSWVESSSVTVLYDLQEENTINRVDVWGREDYDGYYYYRI